MDGRAAKRPRRLVPTPASSHAPVGSERAASLRSSKLPEQAEANPDASSVGDAADFGVVREGARRGAQRRLKLFRQYLSLQDWHQLTVKNEQSVRMYMHQPYRVQYYTQGPTERVFRAWIPADPNESPFFGPRTSVGTVHHKNRAYIIRLIKDQLAATEELYALRQRSLGPGPLKTSLAAHPGANAFRSAKMHQTVLTLRLQGVEVSEYQEKPDRIEVYFEDPSVKMGVPSGS